MMSSIGPSNPMPNLHPHLDTTQARLPALKEPLVLQPHGDLHAHLQRRLGPPPRKSWSGIEHLHFRVQDLWSSGTGCGCRMAVGPHLSRVPSRQACTSWSLLQPGGSGGLLLLPARRALRKLA